MMFYVCYCFIVFMYFSCVRLVFFLAVVVSPFGKGGTQSFSRNFQVITW